jgi:plastocyanin
VAALIPGQFCWFPAVTPDDTMSDPGLRVNYGETKCLMFTLKGTFGFHCVPHLFTGTVVVQ